MNAADPEVVAALVRQGVLVERGPDPSLADLRRVRVPLTDGEAATVAIPLAQALDALHDAGLAYGPPSAGDVQLAPDGRPSLVVPGTWAGAPDDDVPGLLRTLLGVMAPAPLPDERSEAYDEPTVRAALEHLLATSCRSGAEVAQACFATVEPEPVRLPDAGALARAHLLGAEAVGPRSHAPLPRGGRAPLRRGVRSRLVRGHGSATADRPDEPAAPGRRAARRRARRLARLRLGGVAVVALAAVGAVLLRPAVVRADDGPAESPAGVVADPVLDRDAPAAAAAALTRQRAVVIGTGDAGGLGAVDVVGGPARATDEALMASLGGDRLDGLSVDVQSVDALDGGRDDARVAVTSAMSPYRRAGRSGTVAVPGTAPRTVVLHLRWTADGWRVWEVSDPPTSS